MQDLSTLPDLPDELQALLGTPKTPSAGPLTGGTTLGVPDLSALPDLPDEILNTPQFQFGSAPPQMPGPVNRVLNLVGQMGGPQPNIAPPTLSQIRSQKADDVTLDAIRESVEIGMNPDYPRIDLGHLPDDFMSQLVGMPISQSQVESIKPKINRSFEDMRLKYTKARIADALEKFGPPEDTQGDTEVISDEEWDNRFRNLMKAYSIAKAFVDSRGEDKIALNAAIAYRDPTFQQMILFATADLVKKQRESGFFGNIGKALERGASGQKALRLPPDEEIALRRGANPVLRDPITGKLIDTDPSVMEGEKSVRQEIARREMFRRQMLNIYDSEQTPNPYHWYSPRKWIVGAAWSMPYMAKWAIAARLGGKGAKTAGMGPKGQAAAQFGAGFLANVGADTRKIKYDLMEGGIPEEVANKFASISGPIYTAIEGFIPNPLEMFGPRTLFGMFRGNFKKWLGRYAVETLEEAGQGATWDTTQQMAEKAVGKRKSYQLGRTLFTAMRDWADSLGSVFVMMSPGAVASARTDIRGGARATDQRPGKGILGGYEEALKRADVMGQVWAATQLDEGNSAAVDQIGNRRDVPIGKTEFQSAVQLGGVPVGNMHRAARAAFIRGVRRVQEAARGTFEIPGQGAAPNVTLPPGATFTETVLPGTMPDLTGTPEQQRPPSDVDILVQQAEDAIRAGQPSPQTQEIQDAIQNQATGQSDAGRGGGTLDVGNSPQSGPGVRTSRPGESPEAQAQPEALLIPPTPAETGQQSILIPPAVLAEEPESEGETRPPAEVLSGEDAVFHQAELEIATPTLAFGESWKTKTSRMSVKEKQREAELARKKASQVIGRRHLANAIPGATVFPLVDEPGWRIVVPGGRSVDVLFDPEAIQRDPQAIRESLRAALQRDPTESEVAGAKIVASTTMRYKGEAESPVSRLVVLVNPEIADDTTVRHEAVHVARKWGLFDSPRGKRIWKQLEREARQESPNITDDELEELVATMRERWDGKAGLWEQIRRFFRRILASLGIRRLDTATALAELDLQGFWSQMPKMEDQISGGKTFPVSSGSIDLKYSVQKTFNWDEFWNRAGVREEGETLPAGKMTKETYERPFSIPRLTFKKLPRSAGYGVEVQYSIPKQEARAQKAYKYIGYLNQKTYHSGVFPDRFLEAYSDFVDKLAAQRGLSSRKLLEGEKWKKYLSASGKVVIRQMERFRTGKATPTSRRNSPKAKPRSTERPVRVTPEVVKPEVVNRPVPAEPKIVKPITPVEQRMVEIEPAKRPNFTPRPVEIKKKSKWDELQVESPELVSGSTINRIAQGLASKYTRMLHRSQYQKQEFREDLTQNIIVGIIKWLTNSPPGKPMFEDMPDSSEAIFRYAAGIARNLFATEVGASNMKKRKLIKSESDVGGKFDEGLSIVDSAESEIYKPRIPRDLQDEFLERLENLGVPLYPDLDVLGKWAQGMDTGTIAELVWKDELPTASEFESMSDEDRAKYAADLQKRTSHVDSIIYAATNLGDERVALRMEMPLDYRKMIPLSASENFLRYVVAYATDPSFQNLTIKEQSARLGGMPKTTVTDSRDKLLKYLANDRAPGSQRYQVRGEAEVYVSPNRDKQLLVFVRRPGEPTEIMRLPLDSPDKEAKLQVGRQDLANIGNTQQKQNVFDVIDEARNQAGQPGVRSDLQVEQDAQQFIQQAGGESKAKDALVQHVRGGGQLDDVQVTAAAMVWNKLADQAFSSNNQQMFADLAVLGEAYRSSRAESARALRRGGARFYGGRPADMRKRLVQAAIITPPDHVRQKAANARANGDFTKAQELIDSWVKKIKDLLEDLKKRGIDIEDARIYENPVKTDWLISRISELKGSIRGMLREFYRFALLSLPATHAANTVGNFSNAGWHFVVDRPLEAALNTMFFRQPKSAQLGELKYILSGFLRGWGPAVRNFLYTFQTEIPQFVRESRTKTEQVDVNIPSYKGKWGGKQIRWPQRFLLAADEFASTLFAHMNVAAFAYREARARGLRGNDIADYIHTQVASPDSAAWADAQDASLELTFRQKGSKLSQQIKRMTKAAREIELPGGFAPLYYILPFIDTPTNIFELGLRKSPLGSLAMTAKIWENVAAGKSAFEGLPARAAEQLVAWGLVFALMSTLGDDEEEPWITGAKPELRRETAEAARRSYPSQSIKIAGEWWSYSRIEPLATVLSGVVDAINSWRQGGPGEAALDLPGSFVAQVKDKTFLNGVSDLMKIAESRNVPEGAAAWGSRFAASWVPNIIRGTARAFQQNYPERSFMGKPGDRWGSVLRRAGQQTEVMGWLWPDQPKFDIWGRPAERTGGPVDDPTTDVVWRIVSPIAVKRGDVFVGDKIIYYWNEQHPDDPYYPMPPDRKISHQDEQVYLTDEQYARYAQLAGSLARKMTEQAFPGDVSRPSSQQRDLLKKIMETAREKARNTLKPHWLRGKTGPSIETLLQ